MKSIVIFYDDDNSKYKNEKVFNNLSSVDLSYEWATKMQTSKIVTINTVQNLSMLLEKMILEAEKENADNVIFAFNDCPFLNVALSKTLYDFHIKYHSEYTFADGYSKGFAPEVINVGTLKILHNLSLTHQKEIGQKAVSKQSIFDLIKTDINSFEIETVIADKDWRLLRYNFDCSIKDYFISCKNLFEVLCKNNINVLEGDINQINEIAQNELSVLKTVPGFYNIQITDFASDKCVYCPYAKSYEEKYSSSCKNATNFMKKEDFSTLISKIANFSENAVISLSLWGEAFSHPNILDFIEIVLSYNSLSVFIETEGYEISEDFCQKLKSIVQNSKPRTNGWKPVMVALQMDSVTEETYKKIHGSEKTLESVLNMLNLLESALPNAVYPQFVRMQVNEKELESFFRYWKEKENASCGEFIIQKYDDFCGLLSDEKTADLSPIERNVCWHLRRDMNILTNGDVILCKEYVLDNVIGNVFEQDLESIWKKSDCVIKEHISCKYTNKCEKCDESYTYNF